MAIVECGQGHLYNSDQYSSCPYCNGGGNAIDFGGGAGSTGIGKTMPIGWGQPSSAGAAGGAGVGKTVAPEAYQKKQELENKKKQEQENKTVGILARSMSREPVVGWLVCIEGPEKGKDYKLAAKNNTIGRSEKMDVCLKGDNTISRENHARLAYDEKHNNFHLIPAESVNNIYLNDEPVYMSTKLSAYDLIEFGDSKFVFVPFCAERFTWADGLKQDAGEETEK